MDQTTKKTVLYEEHEALGAKLTPYGGYLMPLQYEGIIAEHHAVREEVGMFDVSHMGEFLIEGEGAAAFLDKLLTNPVSDLALGRVRYSPMCYPNGGHGRRPRSLCHGRRLHARRECCEYPEGC